MKDVEYVIDPKAEKRLLRKLDWILLPMFTLIWNAKIAGIEKDLNMHGFDFNIALTVFYIFYIAAEVPSNLALKHFGSAWLAGLVTAFGVVSIGTAFVKSYAGLIATRVFLGIAEGGTLSGLTYILSRYYRRSELVLRLGIFFGAFGGLLASDIGTVASWRKIFLVEVILPTDPQYTRMLKPEERILALARIDADQTTRAGGRREKTTWKLVWRAFNFNTAVCSICYLMINISFQGLSLFMPTVIATPTVQSQLRTVPPYVLGAVWILFNAYYCYRKNQRAIPILFSTLLIVLGYAMAVGTKNSHARYAACFLAIAGGSTVGPVLLTWGTNNAAPDTIRAVATALIPGIGALGSIIAVWTYLPSDAPDYHKGNTLNLATNSATVVLVVIGALYIRWENAKRERGERDYRLEGKSLEEIEQLGYLHPKFRYQV
ncbi:MFS general substrate transporter [Armillaria luteobubalina]|uniref:MFS general substrate transporter n=1 Tax=Armillaria luteobubalina TaxID=153913 RepID=A0AA39UX84_9AGAR|nr:MFS general substrate transporter [Armillaria luteobubalina]